MTCRCSGQPAQGFARGGTRSAHTDLHRRHSSSHSSSSTQLLRCAPCVVASCCVVWTGTHHTILVAAVAAATATSSRLVSAGSCPAAQLLSNHASCFSLCGRATQTHPLTHINSPVLRVVFDPRKTLGNPHRQNLTSKPLGTLTCQYDGHGVCIMWHGMDHILHSLGHTGMQHHTLLERRQLRPAGWLHTRARAQHTTSTASGTLCVFMQHKSLWGPSSCTST